MPKSSAHPPSFEKALAELETIVQSMEEGKLTLEDSLAAYRRGVELLRQCQGTLTAAEHQVQSLEAQLAASAEPVGNGPA